MSWQTPTTSPASSATRTTPPGPAAMSRQSGPVRAEVVGSSVCRRPAGDRAQDEQLDDTAQVGRFGGAIDETGSVTCGPSSGRVQVHRAIVAPQ